MFIIDQKNRKIKLTRGDTATMLVQIFDIEGKEYEIKCLQHIIKEKRRI